jgi:hypothetical protein
MKLKSVPYLWVVLQDDPNKHSKNPPTNFNPFPPYNKWKKSQTCPIVHNLALKTCVYERMQWMKDMWWVGWQV